MINGLGHSLGWFVTAASKQIVTTNVGKVFSAVVCYAGVIYTAYIISERGKKFLHTFSEQQNQSPIPPSSPSSLPTYSPSSSPTHSPTHALFNRVFALDGISPTVPRRVMTPRPPTEITPRLPTE